MISAQCPANGCPEATTPQANAHIGGNQVIGFSNSAIAEGAGKDWVAAVMDPFSHLTFSSVNRNLQSCVILA
jgi:hypothetical protein